MNEDGRRWLDSLGARMLLEVGIRRGDRVLDFGCGTGFYTLPAATAVGPRGMVYALDKNGEKLKTLAARAAERDLNNIEMVETAGELRLPFHDGVMDMVLVYDVLHLGSFHGEGRRRLLAEMERILNPDGILSIFPRHMPEGQAVEAAHGAGFTLDRRIDTTVHHNHTIIPDTVLNFRKREPAD